MRFWRDEPQCVVRWTFRRGTDVVTCQVHQQAPQRFRLTLVPHAPHGMSAVESFVTVSAAMQRHAAIAAELRQLGWDVVAYSSRNPRTPTSRPVAARLAA